jgi:hypothetical protein
VKTFEILGCGFDGRTDATDNRILWVQAGTRLVLDAYLDEVPHLGAEEMDAKVSVDDGDIDFRLPADGKALQAKLREFAGMPADREPL